MSEKDTPLDKGALGPLAMMAPPGSPPSAPFLDPSEDDAPC